MTLQRPPDIYASHLRCPRSSCPDHGKRLVMEIGQDDNGYQGLTVRHSCLGCGYAESGPSTPRAARRSSSTLAALLLRQRLGVEIPLKVDTEPWPVSDV
jgi:hypothetical protein